MKFGAPHVVDLGQELEHSPDSDGVKRAYMVGHGASQEYQPQSWMHGSQVYMSRTKTEVSVKTMSDGAHWEYFAGYKSNGNTPVWKDGGRGGRASAHAAAVRLPSTSTISFNANGTP